MIIPMKRVTLLCLKDNRESVLSQLRDAGVMQIDYARKPDSDLVQNAQRDLKTAERAITLLLSSEAKETALKGTKLSGTDAVKEIIALEEESLQNSKRDNELFNLRERLLPWGNFEPSSLKKLHEKGLFPYLCAIRKNELSEVKSLLPDCCTFTVINQDKSNVYALIIGQTELDAENIFAVELPDTTLAAVETERKDLAVRKNAIQMRFGELKSTLPQIQEYAEELSGTLEFSSACDGMDNKDKIAWIFGYIPVTKVEEFKKTAKTAGFAFTLEDPAEDDENVPTYIEKPKFLNIVDPLFDFIGLTPGYRENDVNVFFLLFFPLFFGLIIGDAAYGTLFLVCAIFGKIHWRQKESMRLPLNLFLLLSCASLTWGWLNGTWAGIPKSVLPCWMSGLDFLARPTESQAAYQFAYWTGLINDSMTFTQRYNIVNEKFASCFQQFLCFAIACVHLPMARLFRFIEDICGSWRAVAHLGWALVLVANTILATNLIVYTSFLATHPTISLTMTWLYGVGLGLILITTVLRGLMDLPSAVIGSFVDVLSYIRLFAVGIAGSYISEKFVEMGGMLLHSLPDMLYVLGLFLLILVAVAGNIMNIGLSFLSVLVHAVRLNTLEFSNHVCMQWSGTRFNPFKNKKKQNSTSEITK